MEIDYVFAYGTLRKGAVRAGWGGGNVVSEAYIEGYDMFDLGAFPGIMPGKGRVRGEVQAVDLEILARLDRIEGYNALEPELGLYKRVRVTAQAPDGDTVDCWVYVFNNHDNEPFELIPCGDWFKHKGLVY